MLVVDRFKVRETWPFGVKLTLVLLSETAGPEGKLLVERLTIPEKPPRLDTVTLVLIDEPAWRRAGGSMKMLKGDPARVSDTDLASRPIAPVTVTV